jgi:hypothetical protein
MLSTGELYDNLGGDYFRGRDPVRVTKRLVIQLEALGHIVTLQEAVANLNRGSYSDAKRRLTGVVNEREG